MMPIRSLEFLPSAPLRLHLFDNARRGLASLAWGQDVPKRAVERFARLIAPEFACSFDETPPLVLIDGAMSHG